MPSPAPPHELVRNAEHYGTRSITGSVAPQHPIPLAGRESRLAPNSRQRRHTRSCFRSRGNASAIPGRAGDHHFANCRLESCGPDRRTLNVLDETEAAAFLLERTESRRKKMVTDSEDGRKSSGDGQTR